jgi:hypothetical protein
MAKHTCFKVSLLIGAVSLFCLTPRLVLAQVTTGKIAGVVTDSSGAAVPDAAVTITQVETSASTAVTTDAAGSYSATALKIGTYTVSVQKQGFQRVVQSNVDLGIGQVVRVDFVLKVGMVTQTVDVRDVPPLLQAETSSLGTIETEKRIVDLPLNGRNFFKLAYLGPGATEGATGTSAGAGSTDNNRTGIALSVNGLRIFDNNFLLDGLDNNEFGNGTVVIQPPTDSIQEFRVEENSMNAEFGRGGAMVNLVLRSGTNQLHGAAWEFIRNDKLDARNWFATSRTPFQRNQFGGQLGGPIVKDKIFIFGSIQRSSIRQAFPFISTVPTEKMRTGDFSELPAGSITDPFTHSPITSIPNSEKDAVGGNIVNIFPHSNLAGTNNGITNNFIFNGKYKFDETAFEGRFDYNISTADRFFAHYAIATPLATNPSNFPNVDGGTSSGGSSTLDNRVQSVAGDWAHSFSPTKLNDLRAGFIRFRDNTLPLDFGQNPAEKILNIPNANRGGNSSGLTKIEISNYQQLGDSLWVPETIVENIYQLADTMTVTSGKHTVKFGADFRRQQRNFFQQTASSGWFNFNGQYSGNALADTWFGLPSFSLQDHLNGIDPTRYWDLSEFVQYDLRATPNLTLNLGLRYEISSPAGGRVGNFDQQRAIVNTSSPHAGVGFDLRDWAPRVGFAWTVRPKTVVRSGAGIFYAPEGNIFDDLGLNPPNLVVRSQSFSPTQILPGQFVSQGFPAQIPTVDPLNPSGTVRTTGPVRKIPRIYEWNLTVEQQFSQNWVVRAGYVGSRSSNLYDHESSNLNQPLQPLDSNFSDPTGNFGRPYFGIRPGLTTIFPLDVARLSMAYHAFQASAEHRFAAGFNVLATYTFAKSLGTADGNVSQCDVQNAHDVAAEKGPVTPDFRHRLSVSYIYELPYGKGRHFGSSANGVARAVLGDWVIAGVTTVRSGEAFNALSGNGDLTNTGSFSARLDKIHNPQDFSFNVAEQAALGCSRPGHQTLDCWFNQAAFVATALAPGQLSAHLFGDSGRAVLRGPDLVNFDFSTYKTFQMTERFGLSFRAEFFNIFNHPNFNLPNVGSGGGSSGAGFDNWTCKSGQGGSACTLSPGGAAITQTVPDNQREIQFGLKLLF